MGGDVTVLDNNVDVLDRLGRHFGPALTTIYSTAAALEESVMSSTMSFSTASRACQKLCRVPQGVVKALTDDPHPRNGLNVCKGLMTDQAVARHLGYEYADPLEALATL